MAGWSGGVFTRARNWAQDKLNSINPQAALFDQEDDNFATGLNNCVTKDGLNKPSATMDFNTQAITGVTDLTFSGTATGKGVAITKVKTGATARTSTTTLADDPDLTAVLVSGKWYAVDINLVFGCTASTGMGAKFNIAYTSTTTSNVGVGLANSVINAAGATASFVFGAPFTAGTIALSVVGNQLRLTFPMSPTGNGTMSLQWAQNSSFGSALTLSAGSWMTVTPLT